MVLGFEESKRKYAEFLHEVKFLHTAATALGYSVQVQDDIELGAAYEFLLNGQMVARLSWNVPHYLTFDNFMIPDTQSWGVDYVKNLEDWRQFIGDIQADLGRYNSLQMPEAKTRNMEVLCVSNRQSVLGKRLRKFAFTQSSEADEVDLTIGKRYTVYGVRDNSYGRFYLILTDTLHRSTPWWMPAAFFAPLIGTPSPDWQKRSFGHLRKDVIVAPSIYFDAIDDIEDGTEGGRDVFKQMRDGPS